MYKWSIPTIQLTGPRKLGGRVSRRGFAFQDAYACLQLTRLLDSTQAPIVVRPEGAQDVDLLYANGREEYLQLKYEPDEHYTLVALRPILQSFAADLLEAKRVTTLSFFLVAHSNHIDAAVTRLRDGKPSAKDITNVAHLFAQSIQGSPAPQCLAKLSESERYHLAEQLLNQTKFLFGMGDEVGGRLSFESHACTELASHGVTGSDLPSAFNTLKAALDIQREFTRADIEELLKHFIGGTAIELFEGRVEALTDSLLSRPANSDRIQQFYSGAPLDWDIIAAHGDIERDQQDDLSRQLSKPSETLRLICIVAEPGAGKSTIARRIAAGLHRQHGAFVIRIRDKEDADVWYRMADFCQKMRRPFYVLADDLFRDPDVMNAIRELSPSLPITVLATSRANEYRPHRLKGKVVRVPLKEPSPDKKERILQRMGKTRADLTPEQRQRLDAANQFLVLMMELTAGKELREIIRDTLEWLQTHDVSAYRAYEHLCFAYRYSISLPTPLLERLDANGRFHNLPYRETAQGLIFYDEGRSEHVRIGHPVIAEIACTFYEALRAPATVLQEMVTAVDMSNEFERRFVAHMLRTLAQAKSPALNSVMPQIEPAITRCQQSAIHISEFTIWRSFYLSLGQQEQADRCVDAALKLVPVSSVDCNVLLNLYREDGRERDGLPVVIEWVWQHPDDNYVRQRYMGLIEQWGTIEQVEQVLQETSEWLAKHPENTNVRRRYLGLVERKGTAEQVERVLPETSAWLAQHSEDNFVRTAYLGLVERKGTSEQVERVLQETSEWLAKHLDDTNVRTAYLGLVERKGTAEQVKRVLQETREWLAQHISVKAVWSALIALLVRSGRMEEAANTALQAISHHPNDLNLIDHYLRLFKDTEDEQAVRQLYEKLMLTYPKNLNVPEHFAAWLRDHKNEDEARALYEILIDRAPRSFRARYGYGRLLLDLQEFNKAVQQFREALKIHKGHQMAHSALAHALRNLENLAKQNGRKEEANQFFTEAEREFREAIYWAGVQGQPQAIFYAGLGWCHIDHESYKEAFEAFRTALDEEPDNFVNYWGVGRALMGLGKFKQAANALRTALENAPEDFQPPASEEIPELLSLCEAAIKKNE